MAEQIFISEQGLIGQQVVADFKKDMQKIINHDAEKFVADLFQF